MKKIRPFLKWAGNKYQILEEILDHLPKGKRLLEPFAGSGAVFLNAQDYKSYIVNDVNPDLINLFIALKTEKSDFIKYAKRLFTSRYNTEDSYYRLRMKFNSEKDRTVKSALFLYLNRHGYNGLCRYNTSHKFNVPFGRYKKPYFPEEEMHFFIHKARDAVFTCEDFTKAMRRARAGDVIYADPPYVPLNETANFTGYSSGGFGRTEQENLANLAEMLSSTRGVNVLISNHSLPLTKKLYKNADQVAFVDVQRYISCIGEGRGKVKELLALYIPSRRALAVNF